ncbi:uncharacterized protein LOC124961767 [Sciurus carolinensis]|uniref:uncharacterized protein LOC124961767 n=1 Tax=Sciurus carolinensis TaxID=30640 RepID=UPI001FB3FF16|nr:uncharacterized protein LOC124961767 [Sciurus carolinensis]
MHLRNGFECAKAQGTSTHRTTLKDGQHHPCASEEEPETQRGKATSLRSRRKRAASGEQSSAGPRLGPGSSEHRASADSGYLCAAGEGPPWNPLSPRPSQPLADATLRSEQRPKRKRALKLQLEKRGRLMSDKEGSPLTSWAPSAPTAPAWLGRAAAGGRGPEPTPTALPQVTPAGDPAPTLALDTGLLPQGQHLWTVPLLEEATHQTGWLEGWDSPRPDWDPGKSA